jgi:hypothetical protein
MLTWRTRCGSAKRLLPLFLALSFIAAAQTITGLPQYGITLSASSDPRAPLQMTNSGAHAIAAVVLAISFAHGGPPAPWKVMIVPGVIPPDSATHGLYTGMPGGDVSAIALDAVVLDDGTYVGPDVTGSFTTMQGAIADQASVASPLVSAVSADDFNAAWTTIANVASKKEGEVSFPKIATAHVLLDQRSGRGDTAAITVAQIYVKLAPLARGN